MSPTTLQAQARALGDPTRHQIFRVLADNGVAMTVNELTAGLGLHHNAIRQHLAKLVEAGLVVEKVGARGGRGRPPLIYEVDPTAGSRWDVVGSYERLAGWLTEVVSTGDKPIEVGRRVGRSQVDDHARGSGSLPELTRHLARHGFEPTPDSDDELVLNECPFASVAGVQPEVVCALHLGFAQGVADELGGLTVTGLQRRPPEQAGCRVLVRRRTGAPATDVTPQGPGSRGTGP